MVTLKATTVTFMLKDVMPTPNMLYHRLMDRQILLGVSDKKFSQMLGLSVPTIKRLENNSPDLKYGTIITVVKFLNL